MGLNEICLKIGSKIVPKKIKLTDEDKRNISKSAENIAEYGSLMTSANGNPNIVISNSRPEEVDRLEKLAGITEANPEIKLFLDFLINTVDSKNEMFLRNLFLEFADFEWNENSVRQNISNWATVLDDFLKLGELMPGQKNPKVISSRLKIDKQEAEFLAVKQVVFKKWKGELKSKANKRKGRLNKPMSKNREKPLMKMPEE